MQEPQVFTRGSCFLPLEHTPISGPISRVRWQWGWALQIWSLSPSRPFVALNLGYAKWKSLFPLSCSLEPKHKRKDNSEEKENIVACQVEMERLEEYWWTRVLENLSPPHVSVCDLSSLSLLLGILKNMLYCMYFIGILYSYHGSLNITADVWLITASKSLLLFGTYYSTNV